VGGGVILDICKRQYKYYNKKKKTKKKHEKTKGKKKNVFFSLFF
jgi:hypothetical protein